MCAPLLNIRFGQELKVLEMQPYFDYFVTAPPQRQDNIARERGRSEGNVRGHHHHNGTRRLPIEFLGSYSI